MNNVKPDWYRHARGRMVRELVFTDEMKQAVNAGIARGSARKGSWRGWTSAAAALIVCIAAAVWALGGTHADDASVAVVQAEAPRETVALHFAPLAPSEVVYAEMKRIPKSSVTVTDSRRFEGLGTLYSYKNDPDDGFAHIAVSFESKLDSTPEDQIYVFGFGLLEQFALESSTLFGEPRVKIVGDGCLSAECVYFDWVRFEKGVAIIDFYSRIPGIESDLDGDGLSEFVASIRSRSSTVSIYKKIGGEIRYAELNEPLGLTYPDSVAFDPIDRTLNVMTADDFRSYRLSTTGTRLERVSKSIAVQPVLMTDLKFDGYRHKKQPPTIDALLFDRIRSLRMEIGGFDIYAQWHQSEGNDFGLFLPNNAMPVKRSDGSYEYDVMKGKGSLAFRDDAPDVPLTYEDDLAVVLNYAGTAARKSDSDSRTDYFLIEYDAEHRVYVEITYKLAVLDKVRPLLLATMANVKYAPKQLK
ncbi:MAG: hypothetical protein J7559_10200 [Cohnella sp.]|nr:hypothetical protein [Cohnella sp.]